MLPLHFVESALLPWQGQTKGRSGAKEALMLRLQAEQLAARGGFDRLLSLAGLSVTLFEHQRRAVATVLNQLRGRAILADEVGLGKTIEAGVIAREYLVRGIVGKVLVLVPATLVSQWRQQMSLLQLDFHEAVAASHWQSQRLIIGSLERAKREPHASRIKEVAWDLVIVDEAHRLKSRRSVNWQFVNDLQKRFLLLLTATPVQNSLEELYNLITLLKPGQLGTYRAFKRQFTVDKHSPKNVAALHALVDEVMVRTTRRETLLPFPKRYVRSEIVPLSPVEGQFYRIVLQVLRKNYRHPRRRSKVVLAAMVLLRAATSHPSTAAAILEAMCRRGTVTGCPLRVATRLQSLASLIKPGKMERVLQVLSRCRGHAIIFVGFRRTGTALVQRLQREGYESVHFFHAGCDQEQRHAIIDAFRAQQGILVSTEAGGEGLNLQFCQTVINYDLPWNPLRLEQRIGRVHRLGQKEAVHVYNLALADTVEAYVLYLLDKKIDMFHKVVGELDAILAHVDGDFAHHVAESALAQSEQSEGTKTASLAFARQLEAAIERYDGQRGLLDSLFAGAARVPGAVPNE